MESPRSPVYYERKFLEAEQRSVCQTNAERGMGIREAEQRSVCRMNAERGRGIQFLDWGTWLWVT